MDGNYQSTKRHLFIAGTGRAGTSFLVRYLTEIGLDTHLSRRSNDPSWDENANAGLEDAPFLTPDDSLPYVVKSPWLYAYIDDMLKNGTFRADAVVMPIRDLTEAAISRSLVERRAVHQSAPWMCELNPSWEEWAHVPGGVIYSLNPIDQGRLLAVGFHHLVQRLVDANIPIVFVAFPRLVEDASYLFSKLQPLLPPGIGEDAACQAHARVAVKSNIRVGGEIRQSRSDSNPHFARIAGYASPAELETIALKRELVRMRQQLAAVQQEVANLAEQERLRHSEAEDLKLQLSHAAAEQAQTERARDDAISAMATLTEEHREETQRVTDLAARLQTQLTLAVQRNAALEDTISRLRASRSWQLTRPYRAVGSMVRLRRHEH